jgi:hypothetical protein
MTFTSFAIRSCGTFVAALAICALPRTGLALTSANLLLNGDASLGTGIDPGTVSDWTVGGGTIPGRDSGGTFEGSSLFIPPASTFAFYGGAFNVSDATTGSLSQVVNLLGAGTGLSASDIDAGKDSFNVSFFQQSLDQSSSPNDQAEVIVSFQNASSTTIAGGYNSGQLSHIGGWQSINSGAIAIPEGARSLTYEMLFTLNVGIALDAFIASNDLTTTSGTTGVTPAVPLPSAGWSGLGVLVGLGSLKIFRRKSTAG